MFVYYEEIMETEKTEESSGMSKSGLVVANVVILVVFLAIVGGVYFWVSSRSKNGQQIFPAGINYLSPNNSSSNVGGVAPLYDFAKLAESSDWSTYKGKIYTFSFQYPKELKPLTFPNDQSESVTFKISNVPPELNLMFLVETISSRDPKLVGQPEEFVKNYWKFFSGLKSLNSIEALTIDKGMKGFKASYLAKSGVVTNDNYFFVITGDSNHLLHLANIFGAEGKGLFNRIVNSLDYKK